MFSFIAAEPPPAYYTYAQQLVGRGHGLPLWCPDFGEHEIGDVGFVDRGQFHRIFNILAPWNDRLNQKHGVPKDFKPLYIPSRAISHLDDYLPEGGVVCGYSTTFIGTEAAVSGAVYALFAPRSVILD